MIKTTAFASDELCFDESYIESLNEDSPSRKRTKQKKRAEVDAEIEKLNEPKKMYCYYNDDPIGNNDSAILGWVRQEMCTPSEKLSFADMVANKTDLDLIHQNNGLDLENSFTLHGEEEKRNIKVSLQEATEWYYSGNAKLRTLALTAYTEDELKEEPVECPITERIKTFEDACRELGEDNYFVKQYRVAKVHTDFIMNSNDILAYLKLRIIAAALNEGWKPQFTEDEEHWYPWFRLWTEEELSEKSDEWKADRHLISIGNYSEDYAGFAFVLSNNALSGMSANVSYHLCFKTEALATYCGKQFIRLWADFYLIKKY